MDTPPDVNVGAFEPLHLYDAPGVALAQIFEGEASAASFKNLFLSPNRLTPEERTDLANKLVGADSNRATKALVGVITNPWVWLMFVTSPTGMKAIQSGLPWNKVGKKFMEFSKRGLGLWDNLRTDMDLFRSAGPLLQRTARVVEEGNELHVAELAASRAKLAERMQTYHTQKYGKAGKFQEGINLLDLSRYRKGTTEHTLVHRYNLLLHGNAHELGKDVSELVPFTRVRMKLDVGIEGNVEDLVLEVPGGDSNAVLKTLMEAGAKDTRIKRKLAWQDWEAMPGHLKRTDNFDRWFRDNYKKYEYVPEGRLYSMVEFDGGGAKGLSKEAWQKKFNRYAVTTEEGYLATADLMEKELKIAEDYDRYFKNVIESNEVASKGVKRTQDKMVEGDMEAVFREMFGDEGIDFVTQEKIALDKAWVRTLGKQDKYDLDGTMELDDDKLTGILTSFQRELDGGSVVAGEPEVAFVQGKEMILQMLDTDGLKRVMGANKAEQLRVLKEEVSKVLQVQKRNIWWRPRNTYEVARISVKPGEWTTPPMGGGNDWLVKQLQYAPYAATNSANSSKRIAPLTNKELMVKPEDLEELGSIPGLHLTAEGVSHVKRVRNKAQHLFTEQGGQALMVLGLTGGETSRMRGMHAMAHLSLDTHKAGEAVLQMDDLTRDALEEAVKIGPTTKMGGGYDVKVGDPLSGAFRDKATVGEMIDRYYQSLAGDASSNGMKHRFRMFAVPGAVGHAGNEWAAALNAHIHNKERATWFANSMVGKLIEKTEWGKGFTDKLRYYGDFNNQTPMKDLPGAVANYLYLSHLGINLGSVVMQMTQPLLLAATVAPFDDVMGAYVDAGKDMATYSKARMALGARVISELEEHTLVRGSMPFANYQGRDLLKWSSHPKSIDPGLVKGGGLMGQVSDVMMAPFAKMELFNRNYAAHLMKRMYAKAGVDGMKATGAVAERFANDVEAFVLRTQFGQHGSNMPHYAREGIFKNPLIRMFTTFPVRSLTGVVDVFPRMGGEENYWNGLKNVVLRGMGMSAITYEAGKALLGADLSPALLGGAVTSIVGGDRALQEGEQMLPVPPIIRIPYDVIRGVAEEDRGMLTSALARTLPGGVALNRALGMAPQMPRSPLAGLPGVLQKQFVDYSAPLPSGEVPVFKGDGMLVGYRKPSEIVAKALGVDMGAWNEEGALDGYLVKQREEIIKYRQQYLMALGANDIGKARGIAMDFQQRFKGLPLTVTKDQAHSYLRNRMEGRTERTLDRLPPEVRWQYQKMVEMGGTVRNLEAGALTGAPTATGRDPFRRNPPPMAAEDLQARSSQAFQSFQP